MVLSRYGTIDSFMKAVSPRAQLVVSKNRLDCIVGDYPTLNNIASAYGRTAPIQWLIAQLVNLSEFCGVKDKLTGDQVEELSWLIAGEYSYYKVSQFLVFFHNFKMGKYGKFYGAVDPLVITTALKEFDKERIRAISQWEDEQERIRREEDRKSAIKFDEYLKLVGLPQPEKKTEMSESVFGEAKSIILNLFQTSNDVLEKFRNSFKKNYGVTPEEYVEQYNSKSNEETSNS